MSDILIYVMMMALIASSVHFGIPYYFIKQNSDVMVRFSTFLTMYETSPESYTFTDAYNTISYDGVSRKYRIGILFPGYIRFFFWLSSMEKKDRDQKQVLASANLIEDWKRDIERKKDEHSEE